MRLREQGERLSGLIYLMAQRLRDALAVSLRLRRASRRRASSAALRMPPRAAERFVADVARSDPARLRAALGALADLELDSRGGAVIAADRTPLAALERGHARAARDRVDPDRESEALAAARGGAGERAPRGTSCARRCCGEARRA